MGSPQGQQLIKEFGPRILEEVAATDLPGLIFTYVWAFDDQADEAEVLAWSAIFQAKGGRVLYVEFEAPLAQIPRAASAFFPSSGTTTGRVGSHVERRSSSRPATLPSTGRPPGDSSHEHR